MRRGNQGSSPALWRLAQRADSPAPTYPRLDLFIRALSAFGVVALGAAGWLYQVRTTREHDVATQRERQSRSCLPVVRALTELELALGEAATTLGEHAISGSDQTPLFPALSSRIDSAAIATLVLEVDPIATVDLPDLHGPSLSIVRKDLAVRSSAFMFADLLRVVAIAANRTSTAASISLEKANDRWVAVVRSEAGDPDYVGLRPGGADAWVKWFGVEPVPVSRLAPALRSAARGLQYQVATATRAVMQSNPEFGDQYVSMRIDLMNSWRSIEPIKTTHVGGDLTSR